MNELQIVDDVSSLLAKVAYDTYKKGSLEIDLAGLSKQAIAETVEDMSAAMVRETLYKTFPIFKKHESGVKLVNYLTGIGIRALAVWTFEYVTSTPRSMKTIFMEQVSIQVIKELISAFYKYQS